MALTAAQIVVNSLNLTVSKSGIVRSESGKAYKADTAVLDILRALPPEDGTKFKASLVGSIEDVGTGTALLSDIARLLKSGSRATDAELSSTYISKAFPTPMSRLQIVHIWSDPDRVILFDPDTKVHSVCSLKVAQKNAATALGKDAAEAWWQSHLIECQRTQYHPQMPTIYQSKHETLWNPYRAPTWSKGWTPPPTAPQCPQLLKDFIEHLTPDKKDRILIGAWLRDMTFGYAEPVLVLAGAPGVGKNTFVTQLGGALVGEGNYHTASSGFKKSRFKAEVSGRRLFFYDEMVLDAELREVFKALHNRSAALETKFNNVGDVEELFCSMVIANNFPHKIELEYSDRKFYVPKLSDTPITDAWGEAKLKEFGDAFKNDAFIQDVAGYLWHKFKPGQCKKFGKSETFRALCIHQYPMYFRRLIELKKTEGVVEGVKFNRHYQHRIDGDKLREYVQHYELQFKEKLGTVEGYGSKWRLVFAGSEDETGDNCVPAEAYLHA